MDQRRATVIGAGLAGLVAADELVRSGWSVELLEARDRVGGRTWSHALPNGAVAEMGAEFVLPGNEQVVALAADLGLELVDKGMRYGRREPRGGIGATEAELEEAVAAVDEALARSDHDLSARAFLDRLPIPDGAREAILARVEISSANDAADVPARDLAGIAHIGDEPSPGVAGGNQGLALALAARLGTSVRLGDAVERVAWAESGVTVHTAGGHVVEAERCVVAVPASVIGRITFEPDLPVAKVEAFAAVRYGHAAKLFVPLTEPAPPGAIMNVPDRWWCWTQTRAGEPVPLVSCFAGSPAALERLEVERGAGRWLHSLSELRPELALDPNQAIISIWDDDPWAAAAYSISPAPLAAVALAEPVGPLHFAGEHTAGPFSGLMEGAIRSGRRAAAEIARRVPR